MKHLRFWVLFAALIAVAVAGSSNGTLTSASMASYVDDPAAEFELLSPGIKVQPSFYCPYACLSLGDDCQSGQAGLPCGYDPTHCACNWCGGTFGCHAR